MIFRRLWPLGLIALGLASTGCDSGRKNPPDVLVRALNATANFPDLILRRGSLEVSPFQLSYLAGDQRTWDEDTYNFHAGYVDIQTGAFVEADTFTKQVSNGTWYTIVLYQKAGNVTHKVLESEPVPATATDAQIQAIHVAESVPTVDLYIVAADAGVTGATPWGTLAFEGTLPVRNIAAGDYDVIATEQGNPAHVLYTSPSFTLAAGAAVTFALTPDSGEGIQPFSMTVMSDASSVLVDPRLQAGVRVINGANDRQPRDVAFNNQFMPPLFAGTALGTATPYMPIAPGTDVPINVTPAGNPGVLELTGAFTPVSGVKYTVFFTGATGTLLLNPVEDDRRRVKSQAKINIYDAAASCAVCDLLVLPPGTDPNTIPALDPFYGTDPHVAMAQGSIVPVNQWAGDFDVVIRVQGTTNVVSGPTRITLKDQGIYGIVLTDNPNGTTIDMNFIDDFQ